jgi:hypothetical protein
MADLKCIDRNFAEFTILWYYSLGSRFPFLPIRNGLEKFLVDLDHG